MQHVQIKTCWVWCYSGLSSIVWTCIRKIWITGDARPNKKHTCVVGMRNTPTCKHYERFGYQGFFWMCSRIAKTTLFFFFNTWMKNGDREAVSAPSAIGYIFEEVLFWHKSGSSCSVLTYFDVMKDTLRHIGWNMHSSVQTGTLLLQLRIQLSRNMVFSGMSPKKWIFVKVANGIVKQIPLPFSLPLLKTVTSFRLTPRPLLMVTASLVSVLKPRRIEPFEWALKYKRDKGRGWSFREDSVLTLHRGRDRTNLDG